MFNFFNKKEFKGGDIPDDRPEKEKAKDFKREEIAKDTKIEWKEKPKEEWADYPVFDQDGSGSCVAQAMAKALGIENIREEGKFVHLSARDLYSRRENDGAGMHSHRAIKDISENGITLEQQMPSQGLDEEEMNKEDDRTLSDEVLAKVFKPKEQDYYLVIGSDPDSIAEVLEEGHPVVMTVKFHRGEWNKKVPELGSGSTNRWSYHKITAIDYFMWKGKKAILIDDSWGPDTGYDGRRVVTEDWFDEGRIYSCYYFEHLENDWLLDEKEDPDDRPEYQFDEDLEHGDRNNEVAKLQEALKIEGFFPRNQACTGYYGGITRKAVKEFQYHYEVADKEELEKVDGFRVGSKTREKLNELFS